MKKIARLKWVEEVFGKDFVLPYRVCSSAREITEAVASFEGAGKTWGMRTDTREGSTQGFNLPFVLNGTVEKALEIWGKYGVDLYYIVSENQGASIRLQAVAVKLDDEHVLFEWNDKEPTISQRQMYNHPENLRRLALGPNNMVFPWNGLPVRSVRPEYAACLKFDRIYDVMVHSEIDETTFTMRTNGQLVIW